LIIGRNARASRMIPAGEGERGMDGETFEERFANLPKGDLDRRARSIAVMRAEGVPVNDWLPILELEDNVVLPTAEQVAMRAAATLLVALKGHGLPKERVEKIAIDFELADWFSPREAQFMNDPSPTERDCQIQTWRYEAANALLWAINAVDRLDVPRELVDPRQIAPVVLIILVNSLWAGRCYAPNPKSWIRRI
jgi:hypothetical protein